MYYKINDDKTGLLHSKTVKDGYKELISEPAPQSIPDGKKAVSKFSETEINVISGWEIVDKTPNEKIADLEALQTQRLIREAALGQEYAVKKLKEIDDEIKDLRKQL